MGKTELIAEPGKHEATLIREFDAPRALVFKAFTDPALVPQWWGLDSSTTVVDKLEVKPGGLWRFVSREADGTEYAFHGVYHGIIAPEQIVYTFEFEGMPGHVLLETITLEERNGKTRVIDSSVFQSVADRDGMLEAGMADGGDESYNRMERLLKTL